MSFSFRAHAYATLAAACDDCVELWITAGGRNSATVVTSYLADVEDEFLVAQLLADWTAPEGAERHDLEEAMARYRACHEEGGQQW